jgi:hypothetical protein
LSASTYEGAKHASEVIMLMKIILMLSARLLVSAEGVC